MISGFEKYHLLIDLQYFYGSFERSFLFCKMSFKVVLFVQSKLRVNASHILCWALGRLHGVKMEVIYHVDFVSVFALMITYFFHHLEAPSWLTLGGKMFMFCCFWVVQPTAFAFSGG